MMRKTGRKKPMDTPMMKSCMNAERMKTTSPARALGIYCNEGQRDETYIQENSKNEVWHMLYIMGVA